MTHIYVLVMSALRDLWLSFPCHMQGKLKKRVASVDVKTLNAPREGKKCLVLDIDYTLFDLGSAAERPEELGRPYLHHFLTSAYQHYDLVIWSATSMKWVEVKMQQLGVTNNPNYKITFMLDHKAMITVRTEKHGKQQHTQPCHHAVQVSEHQPLQCHWFCNQSSYSQLCRAV